MPEQPTTPTPAPARRWTVRVRRYAIILACLYVFWCTLLSFAQTSMLFPRSLPNSLGFVKQPPEGFESWTITTDEGDSVEAWFLHGDGRSAEHPGPAVIYMHGNAELIDHCQDTARWYASHGISVLLPEYRGYGRSGGTPSQSAIARDVAAFYDQLTSRPEVDRTRIIAHGRSLGGGVAAQLTKDRATAALILNCTFTSVTAMSSQYLVPPFLVRHPYRTDRVVETYQHPILIAHGTRDTIIPLSHGERLAALAPGSIFIQTNCSHNDFPGDDSEKYEEALTAFLSTHGFKDAQEYRTSSP